jgi:large subunit ribosomal protein L25
MEKMILNVEKRAKNGLSKLREAGMMPAVYYGRKEKSTPISILEKDFLKIWNEAGESTIISLHGAGKDVDAIIHDVGLHPVTDKPLHADFYVIEKDRKIKVDVPLEFIGEAPAEKSGLVIVKVLHEIEVESLPGNLPQHIEVDLTTLIDVESQILIKDLKLPSGVEASLDEDDVVVSVSEAREEEPETPAEAPDMDSIEEVEKKGKSEEGEGDEGSSDTTKESDKLEA